MSIVLTGQDCGICNFSFITTSAISTVDAYIIHQCIKKPYFDIKLRVNVINNQKLC